MVDDRVGGKDSCDDMSDIRREEGLTCQTGDMWEVTGGCNHLSSSHLDMGTNNAASGHQCRSPEYPLRWLGLPSEVSTPTPGAS